MNNDLTEREWDVINALLDDHDTNAEIARHLGINEKTVRSHFAHIFNKLELRSRTQVAIWAMAQRQPDPPDVTERLVDCLDRLVTQLEGITHD